MVTVAPKALKESRPYRPFKSSEEYLLALREDLAEWLADLYPELGISYDNFWTKLDTGVVLCQHANNIKKAADLFVTDYLNDQQPIATDWSFVRLLQSIRTVNYLKGARAGTFFARDNVHNFIEWCRHSLQILECLLFESDDLILRKNEKHVIFCLMEVARHGARFGMLAPLLVQMEREIDEELNGADHDNTNGSGSDTATGTETETVSETVAAASAAAQVVTNNLLNLDNMVRDLIETCSCPTQFPMIRVGDGKYRIGDSKILIFVRILRNHVMVRVGGGWDTLSHYLDKHDPCRCRGQHRPSLGAKLVPRPNHGSDLIGARVFYERPPPLPSLPVHKLRDGNETQQDVILSSPDSDNGSELSDEGYRSLNFITVNDKAHRLENEFLKLNNNNSNTKNAQQQQQGGSKEWPPTRNNTWNGKNHGGSCIVRRKKVRVKLDTDTFGSGANTQPLPQPQSIAKSPLRKAIDLLNGPLNKQISDSEMLDRIRNLLREYEIGGEQQQQQQNPEKGLPNGNAGQWPEIGDGENEKLRVEVLVESETQAPPINARAIRNRESGQQHEHITRTFPFRKSPHDHAKNKLSRIPIPLFYQRDNSIRS